MFSKAFSFSRNNWLRYFRTCNSLVINGHGEWSTGDRILPGVQNRTQETGTTVLFPVYKVTFLSVGEESLYSSMAAQVAQARNMSTGEHRHCCITFKI